MAEMEAILLGINRTVKRIEQKVDLLIAALVVGDPSQPPIPPEPKDAGEE